MPILPYFPGATFIDLGPDGGPYDEILHPKACAHTTEGSSLAGAENAFKNYPPHLGYDPRIRTLHQYVRMDRHSYSFRGAESDDECIFQIEFVGFAKETHTWLDQWYDNIGKDIVLPLSEIYGVPNRHLKFYGEGDGIVLASPSSPIRLSDSQLRNYSGWLGHQHIPSPDSHWDPGRFLLEKAYSNMATLDADDLRNIGGAVWDGSKLDGKSARDRIKQVEGYGARTEDMHLNQIPKLLQEVELIKSDLAAIRQLISQGYTLTPQGSIEVVARPVS